MSAPAHYSNPIAQSIDNHEERLLRVESTVQSMVGQMAEVAAKQDFLGQQLSESTDRLSNQMEDIFGRIKTEQDKLQVSVDGHDTHLAEQTERFRPLEEAQKAAVVRLDAIKKIGWALIMAAVGAGGTKAIEIMTRIMG